MRRFLFIIFIFSYLISCNEQDAEIKKIKLPKIAFTSLSKETILNEAIGKIGLSEKNSSTGRLMSGISTFKPDSILKVLQDDSSNYTYTLVLEESKNGSFKNIIFKRVDKGFFAFVLEYIPNSSVLDYSLFSGSVKKFDLEGNFLGEVFLDKENLLANGRTQACFADVTVECIEKIYDGYDHSTYGQQLWKCVQWATVMTIDCMGDSQGGTTQVPYGSYIPDEYVGWGITGGDPISGSTGGFISFEGSDPIGLITYEPAADFLRARQMKLVIESNPFALLDVFCTELTADWMNLAFYKPPQSVIDKIKNLDSNYLSITAGDWDIQYIENAQGPVVNMDYFPVTISQLPKDPTTGLQFSPEGFYNYVRTHLDAFFEGNSTAFGPYNSTEASLWNSSNYIGSIMRFDILLEIGGVPLGQQDGSVICSEQTGTLWRFTTIESPQIGVTQLVEIVNLL